MFLSKNFSKDLFRFLNYRVVWRTGMWFQFTVINVGLGAGYVLMVPERKRTRPGAGLVSFVACPSVIVLTMSSHA